MATGNYNTESETVQREAVAVAVTKTEGTLSLATKLGYGVGEISANVQGVIMGFFLNSFLLEVVGLRPWVAGLVLLICKLSDAISDPIVGVLSDNTKTSWGKRRPWIIFGLFPLGLSWFLLWQVPLFLGSVGLFFYYTLVTILHGVACTMVQLPYTTLTAELAQTYNERTSLTMYRFAFGITGGMLGGFIHSSLISSFYNPVIDPSDPYMEPTINYTKGYLISACVFCFYIIIPPFIVFLTTKERPQTRNPEVEVVAEYKVSVKQAIKAKISQFATAIKLMFTNRAFICVMMVYNLAWLAINFVQNNFLLFVRYVIKEEAHFNIVITVTLLSSAIGLFLWKIASEKVGKKTTYIFASVLWFVVLGCATFLPAHNLILLYMIAVFCGISIGAGYLIPWSMVPDVIDYSEIQTGQRFEGVYYALFVFFQKLGVSVGLAVSNFVLGAAGFVVYENTGDHSGGAVPQPVSVLLALRFMIGPLSCLLIFCSMLAMCFYPLSKERVVEMQEQLRLRRDVAAK